MVDKNRYTQSELSGIVAGFCGPAKPNEKAKTPEEYWLPGGKLAPLAWRSKAKPERFVPWLLAREGASWIDVSMSRAADSFLGAVAADVAGARVRGKTFLETKVSREDAAPGAGMYAVTDLEGIPSANPSVRDLEEAARRNREARRLRTLDKRNQEDGEALVASLFPATGDYERAVVTGFGPGINDGDHNYGVGLLCRYSAEVWNAKNGVGKRDALRLEVEFFQPLFATPFVDLSQGIGLRWDRSNSVLALSLRRTGGGPLSGESAPRQRRGSRTASVDRTSVTRGDDVGAQKAGLTARAIGVPIHERSGRCAKGLRRGRASPRRARTEIASGIA